MTKSRKNIIIALLIGLIGSIAMLICVNTSNVKTAKASSLSIEYCGADFEFDVFSL